MESEKVKEIKKVLEEGQFNTINHHQKEGKPIKISFADILTLINELESENERLENKNYQLEQNLGQCENGYKLELHTARYQLHSANENLEKAENRIAELEKENAKLLDSVETVQSNRCVYKCVLTKEHLTKFAERLKEDIEHHHGNYGDLSYSECEHIIDETLKEFIDE